MSIRRTEESGIMLSLPRKTPLQGLLEEWFQELHYRRRSVNTIASYRQTWDLFQRRRGIEALAEVTATEMRTYLLELREKYGNNDGGEAVAYRNIKAFVSYGLSQDWPVDATLVSRHPGPRGWFKVPAARRELRVPDAFSRQQVEQIDKDLRRWQGSKHPQWRIDQRYAVLFHTYLATGLRLNEALRLETDDLKPIEFERDTDPDDARAYFFIRKTKNWEQRYVPVSARLHRDLLRYLNHGRPETRSKRIFINEQGQPLSSDAVKHFFFRLSERVGFRCHVHKCRHTWATAYVRKRPDDIERLRRIGGWKDYKMISRYVHLSLTDLGKGWELIAPY